jgi:hypothetical protein
MAISLAGDDDVPAELLYARFLSDELSCDGSLQRFVSQLRIKRIALVGLTREEHLGDLHSLLASDIEMNVPLWSLVRLWNDGPEPVVAVRIGANDGRALEIRVPRQPGLIARMMVSSKAICLPDIESGPGKRLSTFRL